MQEILFWVIALLTSVSAIATVVTQNIVRAATWLLFALAGTSGIFFLLGADLVGAIQLLVYVGGTLVLVVFGVMLTAQGPFINMKTSGAEYAVSTIVGATLMTVLVLAALSLRKPADEQYTLSEEYRLGVPLAEGSGTLGDPRHPLVKYAPKERLIKLKLEREEVKRSFKEKIEKATSEETQAELIEERDRALGRLAYEDRMHTLAAYAPTDRLVKLTPQRLKVVRDYKKKIEDAPSAEAKAELAEERDLALRRVTNREAATSPYTMAIGQGLLGRPVGPAHVEVVDGVRKVTRTHYLFPFEIVSVHLLVVLIGAAYLARAKRRKTQSPLIAGGPEARP